MTTTETLPALDLATPKQVAFATRLLEEKAHDFPLEAKDLALLSKRGISSLIDRLLACPSKPRASRVVLDVEDGYYTSNGAIAVVKMNREKTRRYAMRLVVANGSGSWEFESGLISRIAREAWPRLSKEQAAEFGRLYGVCGVCGRTLTDPESIAKGIGPVCEGRL